MKEKDLAYWKKNAEEDYMKTPISVLRYISELEKEIDKLKKAFVLSWLSEQSKREAPNQKQIR